MKSLEETIITKIPQIVQIIEKTNLVPGLYMLKTRVITAGNNQDPYDQHMHMQPEIPTI